jgi:cysteine synthase A
MQKKNAPNPSLRSFLKAGVVGIGGMTFGMPFGLSLTHAETRYSFIDANHHVSGTNRRWIQEAIKTMWRDREQAGITPLIKLDCPFDKKISIYLKDESKSRTESLKHRDAWALIMHALIEGKIGPKTHLYEASSGNTAIGEAYFAKLLNLPFTAVMNPGVSEGKLRAIRGYGGHTEIVTQNMTPAAFIRRAMDEQPLSYNINQFANAEKALDFYKGHPAATMNMANEIYLQLKHSDHRCPQWFVAGAGSGGTATSIARYVRKWADYEGSCPANIAVVDPEDSVLMNWFKTGDATLSVSKGSRIEGIGSRGPIIMGSTFSLLREGIDKMIKIPDADSIAAMRLVSNLVGFDVGPSTGTNFCGAVSIAREMHQSGQSGAIVTIICDGGLRYTDNYYNTSWLAQSGLNSDESQKRIQRLWFGTTN